MSKEDQIFSMLMSLCPEAIKPFAEVMLPSAVAQMEEDKKDELLAHLIEIQGKPEIDQAQVLIAFATSMGADPSMFMEMPEMQALLPPK